MRRGTWILALSGAMALNQGAVFAVDPAFDRAAADSPSEPGTGTSRQAAVPASNGMPSRYTRNSGSGQKNSNKNYYSELFADQKPAGAPAAADSGNSLGAWADDLPADPAPKQTAAKPASVAPVASKATPGAAESPKPAADSRKFGATVRGVKSVGDSPESKVIHAAYDKLPPAAERKMIQQVRSEASAKSAAAPMPESGSTGEGTRAAKSTPVAASSANRSVVDSGPQTPQVTIEWVKKGDLNVGQECHFELHVKNNGTAIASQVAVDTIFPNTVRLTSAEPKPAVTSDRATWTFESLAPGAEQKISIKLIPSRRGDLGTTANVRFTGTASAAYRVEEPMLKVALKGPSEVMMGDPASQQIVVSNPGTGTAQDVKVEARLSEGLEHGSRGERLVMEVGSIGPGETRMVRLGLSAVKGGPQSISVSATSSSDAVATASAQLNVIAPSLKIAVEGPALRYKGRNAKFTVTVSNDGSVPNNNIRISHSVADGFKFVSADHSGKFDASSKCVQWFVGRLEPGQTASVACELNASGLGEFTQTAAVLSESGVRAEAKVATKVDGVASLTMELVDIDDPVEIGAETAYEIRVRNEGSKAASGVSIACELPPEMELKTVKAPVDAIVEGRQILFKSLDHVAPGAQVVYRVHVKGVQEGTHRMRVRMTGASLQEPVVREEATKVYSDSK